MNRYTYSDEVRDALETLQQPLAVYQQVDHQIVTVLVSDGFCRLFGYADHKQAVRDMDRDIYPEVHPDDRERISGAALRFMAEEEEYDVLYRTRTGIDADYRVIHAHGKHVSTGTGVRLAHVWYMDEGLFIEGAEAAGNQFNQALNSVLHEESIFRTVNYDPLTNLPNLPHFFKLCEIKKAQVFSEGRHGCLLYLDLNGMKYYNHRNGFAEGDKLLKSFADLMAQNFGSENCCHIGADRFCAAVREEGLEERLQQFFCEAEQMERHLPVRVGIYSTGLEDVPVSMAYDRAKIACDVIPKSGISGFRFYTGSLSEKEKERRYIQTSLDKAIGEKWIRVYYQPIIRAVNEKVCEVEALARWCDPEKGILSPASFIPALEDAGLIYRLDLYMLEEVIRSIKKQVLDKIYIVPHSINLSRSDFDSCDIVEEIRKRVDDAGLPRNLITIEITESIIGSNFEFMKSEVERFRKLGFSVWMDDFGSGYSSLDVLQSIQFDLVKFDMGFMRRLDDGDSGKIILTELMKMATRLGVDTVCEGVETEEQVRFLQEIGCSKLQGFYYSKPVPYEAFREMYEAQTLISHENPEEADYYENIGRVNLYDLGTIADSEDDAFHNIFHTLPIAVIEISGDFAACVRSNQSFREFAARFFHIDDLKELQNLQDSRSYIGPGFISALKQCSSSGGRAFFEEKMDDGTVAHYFVRRIDQNQVTGAVAVAVAVLSISEADESTTYADIARALAADYYNIYVIDLDTNDYIEYSSRVGGEELSVERHGKDFFESARYDTMTRIYEEDRQLFLDLFTKERVLQDLDYQGVFTTTYRLIDTGKPVYVNMKITRMRGGNRIILGISIIDAHMKQLEEEKRLRQERTSLGRIAALSPNYIVLYTVDPVSGCYTQYNPSSDFEKFGLAGQGKNFFQDVIHDAPKAIAPEDLERHLRVFTKDNVMREIQRHGVFIHSYRLLLNGKPVPVNLRAALVPENEGEKLIIGVMNDDREENRKILEEAYESVRDTGIISTHIAQALARGYTDLYYVNMDTDELIEYHTDDELGVLTEARRSADFFEGCERDVKLFVHPEDQEKFVKAMNRDFLKKALDQSKIFEMTYRRIKADRTFYVKMRASRVEEDPRFLVIAVSDIDELVKKRRLEEKLLEERVIYARLQALTGNFICVYVVDPETGSYREFSATDEYTERFSQAKEGTDFFTTLRESFRIYCHPQDIKRVLSLLTRENVMEEVQNSGVFNLSYRIMKDGRPLHVQFKAAMVEEKDGPRLIVGLNDIDVQVRQEEEHNKRLAQAQELANVDALTGVRNKFAYQKTAARMDRQIEEHSQVPFAVVFLDLNNLKEVNDTEGHQAGDQYLRKACKTICDTFKHSPVFRVGGDEFLVIAQGKDYANIEELVAKVSDHNEKAMQSRKDPVIACGMSRFEQDSCVSDVFKRADSKMYEDKTILKEKQKTLKRKKGGR